MRNWAGITLVFLGGFALMVIEIVGARYLAKDFGGSFYVWTSQIGIILVALALGYYLGGRLADRFQRPSVLLWLLLPAGLFTMLIPSFAGRVLTFLVMRHPLDHPVPLVWQKLDPAIGSALIFLFPCLVLATLSPCVIRWAAAGMEQVGRTAGSVYASSTAGSIAGVFASGYVLIDHLTLSQIFRATGVLTLLLGGLCCLLDRCDTGRQPNSPERDET